MGVDRLIAGQRYDLAILGGGVAGLACAIEASQLGLSTLVIDRPNARLHPGECLHPGTESLLQRLGLGIPTSRPCIPRPLGIWHTRNGASLQFVPYGQDRHGPWRGYQLRRSLLVRLLVRRAVELGVHRLMFKGKVELVHANGTVNGLALEHRAVPASYVVDAAGGAHWIARKLGIAIHKLSHPLYVHWGYVKGGNTAWDHAPWLDMRTSGWVWRARVGRDVHGWVQLTDHLKHTEPPDMGSNAQPLCRQRGADASWRMLGQCAGPGWMAVGDAAAVLDPVSGDGVLRAMTTGIAAAATAAAQLAGSAAPASDTLGYDALLRAGVTRRADLLRQHVPWVNPQTPAVTGEAAWPPSLARGRQAAST